MKRFSSIVLIVALLASLLCIPANASATTDLANTATSLNNKAYYDLGLPSTNWCCYFVAYCINNSQAASLAGKISRADSGNPMTLINWACAKNKIATYYSFTSTHYNRLLGAYKNISITSVSVEKYEPIPGDIIIFDWNGRADKVSTFSHAGIVADYSAKTKRVTFVDGNSGTGNYTYVNKRSVDGAWSSIIGYIHFNDAAKKEPKTCTVTFDPNGGTVSQKSKQVAAGDLIGAVPTPTRTGYQFSCWTFEREPSGSTIGITGDNTAVYIEKDTTLYAQWREDKVEPPVKNVSEGWYTLTPKCAPNSRLDVWHRSTADKANVHIWSQASSNTQSFYISKNSDGTYKIATANPGKVIDVDNGGTAKGTNVWQYKDNGSNAQKWTFLDAGDGYVYIVPKVSASLRLDVNNKESTDGTNVQVWTANNSDAQKWKLTATSAPASKEQENESASEATATSSTSNVMVDVPWKLINECGHQSTSGPCMAYSWAYGRIIADKESHSYTDYWAGDAGAVGSSTAGYNDAKAASSDQELLRTLCSEIKAGRPVVVTVQGYNAPTHFVVAIGYKSDCNMNNLKTSDILILDPANKSIQASAGNSATYTYLSSQTIHSNRRYWTIRTNGGTSTGAVATPAHTTHVRGSYVTFEAAHPHKDIYYCSVCGEKYADASTSNYYDKCTTCNPKKDPVKTDGTYYSIKNKATGKVLNVYYNRSADGTNVDIYDMDYTDSVYWKFAKSGGGYVLSPKNATGSALNVYSETKGYDGCNVCIWKKTGHSTQTWFIEAVEGGYILRSDSNTGLVLTATGSKNNSNVNLKAYSAGDNYQIWNFYEK